MIPDSTTIADSALSASRREKAARAARLRVEMLSIYVRNHSANTYGVPLACIIIAIILAPWVPVPWLCAWVGITVAASLVSGYVYDCFMRAEPIDPARLRPWLWAIGLPRFVFIISWCSTLFWAWSQEEPLTIVLPLLMIGTTMAMNAATSGSFLPFYLMELVPKVAAMAIVLTTLDGPVYEAIIAMFALGVMFVLKVALSVNRTTRTILEQKQEIAAARDDLRAADNAKSVFLATMSHEVRTPLNGILGILNLLKDTDLDKRQRGHVETIRYSAETLLTMLNDVLDFSKIEAGKMSIEKVNFDLHRLVRSVADLMVSRAHEKGVTLDWRIDLDVPEYINTDPTRLRQVLLNLVSNAIKFTEKGGVSIRISNRSEEGWGAQLHFEVKDTGVGVPLAARDNLFREFSQADSSVTRRYGGTGLGLVICARIVALMKGKIGFDSAEGVGSVFWFELPVGVVDVDMFSESVEEENTLPQTLPLSILVVDDNAINREVAMGLLERGGHRVTTVNGGADAVRIVRRELFDIVLMDMQMPGMDGLQATREIRALGGNMTHLPIIALTANALRGDDERCRAAGMNDHLGKPIDPHALYVMLARYAPADKRLDDALDFDMPAADTPEMDMTNLLQIEKSLGRQYVVELIHKSLPEIDRYMATLLQGEGEAMQHAAHELKTLCALFGMTGLAGLAEGIEQACAARQEGEARRLATEAEARFAVQRLSLTDRFGEEDARTP